MKCPACSAEFRLTWRRYLTAPSGHFPCPGCQRPLVGRHRWWYWPLLVLGCCACGVPCAILVGIHFGRAAALGAWIVGGLISGMPFDKYLENRFTALVAQPGRSGNRKCENP